MQFKRFNDAPTKVLTMSLALRCFWETGPWTCAYLFTGGPSKTLPPSVGQQLLVEKIELTLAQLASHS